MLPKFASNLFGHFPRTANTFRSGFFNSSQGSSAGGAKYNAGNRFYNYNGYSSSSRAVAQAITVASNDDDRRPKFHKISLIQRNAAEYPSLFAPPTPRSVRVRRNSTSTATAAEIEGTKSSLVSELPTPAYTRSASPAPSTPPESLSTDPAAPQSVLDPTEPRSASPAPSEVESDDAVANDTVYFELRNLPRRKVTYGQAVGIVERYKKSGDLNSIQRYNAALQSLLDLRPQGKSITFILETYNELVGAGLVPNTRTYRAVLLALCQRDFEISDEMDFLKTRLSRREICGPGFANTVSQANDRKRLAEYEAENNINSALTIFRTMTRLDLNIDKAMYSALIKMCAHRGAVDAAVRVFAHYESKNPDRMHLQIILDLMGVYCTAKDVEGGRLIFDDFRNTKKKIIWPNDLAGGRVSTFDGLGIEGRGGVARVQQMLIWSEMIRCYFSAGDSSSAIALLEEMINTPNGLRFSESEPPLPAMITYSHIIKGFCDMGDLESALIWFNKLLDGGVGTPGSMEPTLVPGKPSIAIWDALHFALAKAGHKYLHGLNEKWALYVRTFKEDTRWNIYRSDCAMVLRANLLAMREGHLEPQKIKESFDLIRESILDPFIFQVPSSEFQQSSQDRVPTYEFVRQSIEICLKAAETYPEYLDKATALLLEYARYLDEQWQRITRQEEQMLADSSEEQRQRILEVQERRKGFVGGNLFHLIGLCFWPSNVSRREDPHCLTRDDLYTLSQVLDTSAALYLNESMSSTFIISGKFFTRAYVKARQSGIPQLTGKQWDQLIFNVYRSKFEKRDQPNEQEWLLTAKDVLCDIRDSGVDPRQIEVSRLRILLDTLIRSEGRENAANIIQSLDESFINYLQDSGLFWQQLSRVFPKKPAEDRTPSSGERSESVALGTANAAPGTLFSYSLDHDKHVEEYVTAFRKLGPEDGYKRVLKGLEKGLWPRIDVVGRLINSLGRRGKPEAAKQLYNLAQDILATMVDNPQEQSLAWFQIEDQMLIGMAHAGDLDAAHTHRERILQQGGTPSADSYGALISGIKDTTDDASSAYTLWQEAKERGLAPNLFLYNTIISRLAKARKADQALELFQEMKSRGVHPSTVTYGAVITACCRVADSVSAEALFSEMERVPRYTPRVPPFNTIMQLFTTTYPNREKVLYYYQRMLDSKVKPSDHTYKLLLDALGSIKPVDEPALWETFEQLRNDPKCAINGTHWSSLIYSYGCVQGNLNRSLEIFDSVTGELLPDAVVYEALFNSLVTNNRVDLFEIYLRRMHDQGVHMTAYIANVLIRGYVAVGNISDARSIFESLSDPAFGVAASDNRASHKGSETLPVSPLAPVYREPSTWEAMIRAELAAGNRLEAEQLVERMRSRGYPAPILGHIEQIVGSTPVTDGTPSTPLSPSSTTSTFGSSSNPSSIF